MGNRKLPFGYRMEMGVEVIYPKEAEVVRDIFDRYLNGDSFKLLAERLECESISYDEGKSWNKNMIARMLADVRYVGGKGFPAILEARTFQAAAERRRGQQRPVHRTDAEKVIRQLSGRSPTARISAQVIGLLNSLICNTKIIQAPEPPSLVDAVTCRRELERVLTQLPVDEDRANLLVRQAAILGYQAISSGEYETERLKRLFTDHQPMEQLDADFLQATVTSIATERNKVVNMQLKNQQVIEGSDTA